MSGEAGVNTHLACPGCSYCLDGHAALSVVRCPECGGTWRGADLLAATQRDDGFRTWMIPVFLLPPAALTLLDSLAHITWRDHPVVPPSVFVVLFAMALFALRDQRGIQRVGTAFVLAEMMWLTSALLARFLPWLPA